MATLLRYSINRLDILMLPATKKPFRNEWFFLFNAFPL